MRRPDRFRSRDDLFELFPDLPRPRRVPMAAQRARTLNLVAAAKARAADNVKRQQAAAQRVRDAVLTRQRRIARGRGSTLS